MRDGCYNHRVRYQLLFKESIELEIMLSDFSLLNRIETPDLVLQKEWLSSEEIIQLSTAVFNILADKEGINLIARWDKFYFKADSSLFIRAASNLIQNALSYSSSGAEVHLSFRLYDNMIQLTVENPGTIPEEETAPSVPASLPGREQPHYQRFRPGAYHSQVHSPAPSG